MVGDSDYKKWMDRHRNDQVNPELIGLRTRVEALEKALGAFLNTFEAYEECGDRLWRAYVVDDVHLPSALRDLGARHNNAIRAAYAALGETPPQEGG